ncbi:MAG: helix-turn-helix transcriptional regulator [Muribaculaceae bacterium]|nr:helix-turn-helix transcriptional regulator [Muribaculaceae bacterium]
MSKRVKIAHTPILDLLAFNIKYYRKRLNMSQEKLADRANLHPTYISNIEQGKRNLSIQNVYQIAEALGLSVVELLTEIKEKQK